MNFLRLSDSLLTILFEDDDIIAIDKPYGFNAHTNDSKADMAEFIQDGLIEIFEKQRGQKLHIIHRLDQTTTGVMIFGKSVESAKKYAEYFFNRQVQKTYWFITKNKSVKPEFTIDQPIVHKGRDLDANTQLFLLKKSKTFELWKALPHTGRNHQIRIHAKAAGLSILGDPKYEGAPFTFLCLHNHKIEFPNGVSIESRTPVYFDDLEILEDSVLVKALFEIDRRLRLFSRSAFNSKQSFRLVHTKNNAKESGFSIDQFGENLVMDWYGNVWNESENKRFKKLVGILKKPLTVRWGKQQFVIRYDESDLADLTQWSSYENEICYTIKNGTGLFLNQRLQRKWILENAKDKSVLNLFSYTGSFGLAAAAGGAKDVTSVESNKNIINWARENFKLNNLERESYKFFLRDSLTFLEQAKTKNIKYDLIICDTPSFFRREKGIFKVETGLENLLKLILSCANPKAQILFSTQYDGFFINDVRSAIVQAQRSLKMAHLQIDCILPSLDFELPDDKANLKSFLIHFG